MAITELNFLPKILRGCISFHIDIGPAPVAPVPTPPVVYKPEEEYHHPRGHAWGYYHRHRHEHEDEDEDD